MKQATTVKKMKKKVPAKKAAKPGTYEALLEAAAIGKQSKVKVTWIKDW